MSRPRLVRCRRGHDIKVVGRYNGIRNGYGPCKACNRINAADSRKRRIQWLQEIKLKAGCSKCGYKRCASALDFHHVRGRKSFGISSRPYAQMPLIKREIRKCVVICKNCHMEMHQHD